MEMTRQIPTRITPEEYLAWEEKQVERHEFIDGKIRNMAGGSVSHTQICVNVTTELHTKLRGGSCRVFAQSHRVEASNGDYFYPDVFVSCGTLEIGKQHAIRNPLIIVEVLSPSTSNYDRAAKLQRYQEIESVQECLLVHQKVAVVEHLVRGEEGHWWYTVIVGLEASLTLTSLNVSLPLNRVFEDIPLEEIKEVDDSPLSEWKPEEDAEVPS